MEGGVKTVARMQCGLRQAANPRRREVNDKAKIDHERHEKHERIIGMRNRSLGRHGDIRDGGGGVEIENKRWPLSSQSPPRTLPTCTACNVVESRTTDNIETADAHQTFDPARGMAFPSFKLFSCFSCLSWFFSDRTCDFDQWLTGAKRTAHPRSYRGRAVGMSLRRWPEGLASLRRRCRSGCRRGRSRHS